VFVDESGLSERPTRVRTWAPKGQTPVVQFHFNWKQLSMIAGLTAHCCYFRLFTGTIKSEQIVLFLKALRQQLRQPLLILWDGLRAHRSRLVRDYVDNTKGHIQLAFLPAYAPELNPVEYLWACSNGMPWRTTVPTTCRRSPTLHATNCARRNVAPPSSPLAGNKQNCSDVMSLGNTQ
jgi:hypothetical protein